MLAQPRQAYVVYGLEPGLVRRRPGARKALAGAQVVAFSQFACASTRDVADVILPIGALPEIDATLTNLDGREQSARAGGKLPGEPAKAGACCAHWAATWPGRFRLHRPGRPACQPGPGVGHRRCFGAAGCR